MSVFSRTKGKDKDVTPNTTIQETHTVHGKVVEERESQTDEFQQLCQKDGNATISCSITKGVEFNSEKVVFFVSIRCDQDNETMDKAAILAFNKASLYVEEAGKSLGWYK